MIFTLKTKNSNGFTILELMIATTIFSTILLLCTYGLIQVGNTYYKGATTARTQAVARSIMDDISYEIQYGTAKPQLPSPQLVCIGPTRFSATLNAQVTGATHGLLFDRNGSAGCAAPGSGKELLGENMRLTKFSVTLVPATLASPEHYDIIINVVYGDTDLIDGDNCRGTLGNQFCASAYLESSIRRRKS